MKTHCSKTAVLSILKVGQVNSGRQAVFSLSRPCRYAERSASADVIQKPDGGHTDHQTRPAVTYQRQGQAGNRHQSQSHTDINNNLCGEHRNNTDGEQSAKRVCVMRCDFEAAGDDKCIKP